MCLGAQKNCFIETVLLSTHNICFDCELRKIIFWYTLLTKGLTLLLGYELNLKLNIQMDIKD